MKSPFAILKKRPLLAPALVLFLLVLGATSYLLLADQGDSTVSSPDALPSSATRLLPVETVTIRASTSFQRPYEFLGALEMARSSPLAFDQAGEVVELMADEGDTVEAGQVLARLDIARLEARRKQILAALESAQASLELAEKSLGRIEKLRDTDVVPEQRLDDVSAQAKTSRAALDRTRAEMDGVEVEIAKSTLRAPYAGTIARRLQDEGTVVQNGTPIFELLETGEVEARVGVTPEVARTLATGQAYPLQMASSGGELSATLRAILPRRQTNTRTVDAIFDLQPAADDSTRLFQGDMVKLIVEREVEKSGVWLPRSALVESLRGLWACYLLEPLDEKSTDGRPVFRLQRRDVDLLEQQEARAYVSGVLPEGALVLKGGLQRITPGQRVVPARPQGGAQ